MKNDNENNVEDLQREDTTEVENEAVVAETAAEDNSETVAEEPAVEEQPTPSVTETGEIIAAIGVHEATAENILPTPQEIAETMPGIEEIAKEPQKRKNGLLFAIIGGAVGVALLLVALVIGIYFAFFSTTSVDVFADVEIVYDGANGYAVVEDGIKPYVSPSANEAQNNGFKAVINYTSDAKNVSNGDVITVTAVVNQELLDQYRISPESLTKQFTVSGLATVPAKYSDIPGEADIRSKATSFVEGYRQDDIDAALNKVSGSTLVSDEVKLYAIAYKADPELCNSGKTTYDERCGTIQYIFDHQVKTESTGYNHTYGTWRMYGLTNIQVLENGTLFQTTNYVVDMDDFDSNNDGFIDDGEMKAGYERLGYTFLVQ
ncbi:hypothetical protein [Culicoidibacter larvae]|uniref:EF-hand domain-containing protein n=1 Tax=Culicoidibacter larvae TaxID=2579976 RepID=A0A5R8QCC5_9FIRM|nr:hypothetical protein [Culicoidibacter larvae]TLG72762.1 hypothetical protein FEZ08_08655 [Culicoidibacter larvae]